VVIEAVTFDFWNTLMYEEAGHLRGRRLAAWIGILEDAGFAVERQQLDAAFDASWDHYVAAWKANQQFSAVDAAGNILERMGFDMPPGNEAEITPTPNSETCLGRLRKAGVRIGIVCDVGMTPSTALRRHLERHGLLEHFTHWSFSDEVGVYKPAPAIFEHALTGLGGVAPDRAAHVGDLRRTDVAGAKAMGMTAIRYTGVFDDDTVDEPEADHVVGDLANVPAVLGLP
jgi:putative hydrolase of the HAD superfamily